MAKKLDLCTNGKGHISFINCEGIGRCIKCGREKDYYTLLDRWENRYRTKMGEGGRNAQRDRKCRKNTKPGLIFV